MLPAYPRTADLHILCVLHAYLPPLYRPGPLCVLNTHLFYHPYAPHIRTMHTAAILEEAAAFITSSSASIRATAPMDPKDLALVFCGDFNSDLNEGIPGMIKSSIYGKAHVIPIMIK